MKKLLTTVVIIAIVLVGIPILILNINKEEKNLYQSGYPVEYKDIILDTAKKYDLKPSLLFALIYTESRFKPEVVSNMGAVGLTQITKDTFDWIKYRMNDESDTTFKDIKKPEVAIDYGAYLLKQHLNEFNTINNALCAYNAGRGNLMSWLKNDEYSKDTINGRIVTKIPFEDTQAYVDKINEVMLIYQKLYDFE